MRDEHELARRERARVRAVQAVFPYEYGIVAAVEPEPVIWLRHNIHDMPPVPVKAPDKLQRGEAEKGGVQHPGNDCAQVGALKIQHETPVQFFRFRRGCFTLRRSGAKRQVRTVQHPVLAGKHGRRHLIIRRKFPQYVRLVPTLAQHRVRVRQGIQPAVQLP